MSLFNADFGGAQFIPTSLATGQVAYLIADPPVPLPPSVWLFMSALLGLFGLNSRRY